MSRFSEAPSRYLRDYQPQLEKGEATNHQLVGIRILTSLGEVKSAIPRPDVFDGDTQSPKIENSAKKEFVVTLKIQNSFKSSRAQSG